MNRENFLIVGDSERDANLLYAVGMFVPDPFIYLQSGNQQYIVLSDLEIDRARRQASHCKILSLGQYQQKARRNRRDDSFAPVIKELARDLGIKKCLVPMTFPHGLARQLRDLNVKIKVKDDPFFPSRLIKNSSEVKKISAALMMAEVGLSEAIQVLKSSKIGKDRKLLYRNVPLTSEKLRATIDTAIIQAGGIASHTIVAGGKQGCDPHEKGFGPLYAHDSIIIDVFPRSQKTGYFGDITRTVVRGKASEALKKVYQTVARGQELAFAAIKNGVSGREPHKAVLNFFENEGFKTGKRNGRMEGFFHSTGHGLGLEIHEGPRLSARSDDTLTAGQVVTVEPGLYYPEIGGVRLEDVAYIAPNQTKNLTKFEKVLEI